MTPDDQDIDRLRKQYEGLLTTYGALMETQTRHDERIDNATADRLAIRSELKEMRVELLGAIGRSEQRQRELVTSVKASCDKGWDAWEKWVAQYERDEKERVERDVDRGERSLMSRRQVTIGVIALVLTALGMILTLIAMLAGGAA